MRTSILVLAAVLTGCDTDPATLAGSEAPPPGAGGLELVITGFGQGGSTYTATVTGAQGGQPVVLAFAPNNVPGATCIPQLNGLCVDLANPTVLGRDRADATGTVVFDLTLPPNLPQGVVGYFQAAAGGTAAATSNVQVKWVPVTGNPIDGTVEIGMSIDTTTQNGDATVDYRVMDPTIGLDFCSYGLEAPIFANTAAAPCPGCEYVFDIDHGGVPFTETFAWGGDCSLTLGGVPENLLIIPLTAGIDVDYASPAGSVPLFSLYYGGLWIPYPPGSLTWDDTTGDGTLALAFPYGTY